MIRSEADRQRIREEGSTREELQGYLEVIAQAALAPPGSEKNRMQQLLSDQLEAIAAEAGIQLKDAMLLLRTKVINHVLARGLGFATPKELLAYFYGWTRHEEAAPGHHSRVDGARRPDGGMVVAGADVTHVRNGRTASRGPAGRIGS